MNYAPIIVALGIAAAVWAVFNVALPYLFPLPPRIPPTPPAARWNPEEAEKAAILARIRKIGIAPHLTENNIYNGITNQHLR